MKPLALTPGESRTLYSNNGTTTLRRRVTEANRHEIPAAPAAPKRVVFLDPVTSFSPADVTSISSTASNTYAVLGGIRSGYLHDPLGGVIDILKSMGYKDSGLVHTLQTVQPASWLLTSAMAGPLPLAIAAASIVLGNTVLPSITASIEKPTKQFLMASGIPALQDLAKEEGLLNEFIGVLFSLGLKSASESTSVQAHAATVATFLKDNAFQVTTLGIALAAAAANKPVLAVSAFALFSAAQLQGADAICLDSHRDIYAEPFRLGIAKIASTLSSDSSTTIPLSAPEHAGELLRDVYAQKLLECDIPGKPCTSQILASSNAIALLADPKGYLNANEIATFANAGSFDSASPACVVTDAASLLKTMENTDVRTLAGWDATSQIAQRGFNGSDIEVGQRVANFFNSGANVCFPNVSPVGREGTCAIPTTTTTRPSTTSTTTTTTTEGGSGGGTSVVGPVAGAIGGAFTLLLLLLGIHKYRNKEQAQIAGNPLRAPRGAASPTFEFHVDMTQGGGAAGVRQVSVGELPEMADQWAQDARHASLLAAGGRPPLRPAGPSSSTTDDPVAANPHRHATARRGEPFYLQPGVHIDAQGEEDIALENLDRPSSRAAFTNPGFVEGNSPVGGHYYSQIDETQIGRRLDQGYEVPVALTGNGDYESTSVVNRRGGPAQGAYEVPMTDGRPAVRPRQPQRMAAAAAPVYAEPADSLNVAPGAQGPQPYVMLGAHRQRQESGSSYESYAPHSTSPNPDEDPV